MRPLDVAKVNKVMLAKTMGWSLTYIEDELDWTEFHETLEILDAVEKARAYRQDVERWKAQGRSGGRR